jgi:hypothetical protein
MKKILFAGLSLLHTFAFAANAIVNPPILDTSKSTNVLVVMDISVIYMGADVTGGVTTGSFTVSITSTTSPSALLTEVVSGVQSLATSEGFTVSANHTLVPSYSLQ